MAKDVVVAGMPNLSDTDGAEDDAHDFGSALFIARWFARAARQLQQAAGWHDTLQQMVELAAKIAAADFAVIQGVPSAGASPELLAATDYATGVELVALQAAAGSAPAWQAIQDRTTVQVDDLSVDPRWQPCGATVGAGSAFRSVLAFCLLLDGQPVASLAVYSRAPQAFTPARVELAATFADHATVAFEQIMQEKQIGNLRIALDHARDIGAAIGIIMNRLHITQSSAFDALRRASQERNIKLYDLATGIICTGELPFPRA